MRRVELNITREQAKDFILFLIEDNNLFTSFDVDVKNKEITEFSINGHLIKNYSNQFNHIIIDNCYVRADNFGCYMLNNQSIENIDYCLKKLGF